jgi:hypothetical protein
MPRRNGPTLLSIPLLRRGRVDGMISVIAIDPPASVDLHTGTRFNAKKKPGTKLPPAYYVTLYAGPRWLEDQWQSRSWCSFCLSSPWWLSLSTTNSINASADNNQVVIISPWLAILL